MSSHANADQTELNNFNQFAHTWWDASGEFGALHTINPFRLEFIESHTDLNGKTALDIGCGGGILTEALTQHGAQTTGIDLAEEVLTIARLHSLESELKIDYLCIAAEAHAKAHPEHYDVVTCMEMLEHVPDPSSIIRAASNCVKPGGWVFFSTLNRNYKAYLLGIFAAENLLDLVPKGTHTYDKFIQPSELDQMARQVGLQLRDGSGIKFNPILNQYGLSDNLDVNYLLAYQKI